jgi:phosphatidyl-myo-inositol dimannoside synthase
VTRNLPPLVGGMERLLSHVVEELASGFRVAVIGPAGCGHSLAPGVRSVEIAVQPLWKFLVLSMWRALAIARKARPRLFFAGSGLTAPITWLAARLSGGRCVVYLHGLDVVAPSAIYRRVWLPTIRRHDLCIVNSQYSRSLALAAGVPDAALSILNPGVEMPAGNPGAASVFRRNLGMEDAKMLLYVGRLTPRKGLLEFVERALPQLVKEDPAIRLVVIGEEAADAISGSAPGYLSRVKAVTERLALAGLIHYVGVCPDQILSAAYDAADVLVFPVIDRPGDAEGFGMVALEAAAHGTPTVAFEVGGLADAVRDGVSGALVKSGDYAEFVRAVLRIISGRDDAPAAERCRAFAADFQWEVFGLRLRKMIAGLGAAAQRPVVR